MIGWQALLATFALAWSDDQYTHILLILPVFATLIYLDRDILRPMSTLSVPLGSVLVISAVLIFAFVRWRLGALTSDVRLSISMLALVIWWIGAFVVCFGIRASRALLFPLCFLFGVVPVPQVLLNEIVWRLQQGSALAAYSLFAGFGIPVVQDGVILTIPGLSVEVAKECSSIRSSSMLLVTTLVLAQLFLRSPWRKALVVAITVPLSIAKNGLRIFTIAMLATRIDPGFLTGKLHHQGGSVFFAIALAAVFGLIWILRRAEREVARTTALHPVSP
jgi:exosortase